MIKINLLPQRKVKRPIDKGQQSLLVGVGALLAAAAGVYLLLHMPLVDEVDNLASSNAQLSRDNKSKKDKLVTFEDLKKANEAAKKRSEAILKLANARAVPAYMLRELMRIMTPGKEPTMSKDMTKRLEKDVNRQFEKDWDPKHVWITAFSETQGKFSLSGGAQSDADMTQLAKRLQASVYFSDVVPEQGDDTIDREGGITYYRFNISGRVVY